MNMVFFDVETGGLDEQKTSLLEVAFAIYQDGQVKDTYSSFLRHETYHVEPEALDVNQLDIREVHRLGKSPQHVVDELKQFLGNAFPLGSNIVLAGHNQFLDRRFMNKLFADHGENFTRYTSHRTLDTMSLLYGLHAIGKLPPEALSLSGALSFFEIKNPNWHRALDDTLCTVKLYEKCLERIKDTTPEPLAV